MDHDVPRRRFILVADDAPILRMNAVDMFEDAALRSWKPRTPMQPLGCWRRTGSR
jgi:hypothetical protein